MINQMQGVPLNMINQIKEVPLNMINQMQGVPLSMIDRKPSKIDKDKNNISYSSKYIFLS